MHLLRLCNVLSNSIDNVTLPPPLLTIHILCQTTLLNSIQYIKLVVQRAQRSPLSKSKSIECHQRPHAYLTAVKQAFNKRTNNYDCSISRRKCCSPVILRKSGKFSGGDSIEIECQQNEEDAHEKDLTGWRFTCSRDGELNKKRERG